MAKVSAQLVAVLLSLLVPLAAASCTSQALLSPDAAVILDQAPLVDQSAVVDEAVFDLQPPPPDLFLGYCTPGAVRSCGVPAGWALGSQTCSPNGSWCNCFDYGASDMGGDWGDPTDAGYMGCRGTGRMVCGEHLADVDAGGPYPCYFRNHPYCMQNTSCPPPTGPPPLKQFYSCNERCGKPTEADKCMCSGSTDGGMATGCASDSPCGVCTKPVAAYGCYFIHHPQCSPSACSETKGSCIAACPAPTDNDIGSAN